MVNTSTGYVNASTGASDSFSDSLTLAPEMKTFYDTELLENARTELEFRKYMDESASKSR